jgi:GNAT superfamily N-acetyltransferase
MLSLVRTTAAHDDFRNLTGQLDSDLWARYGQEQEQYDPLNRIDPSARAVVAYDGAQPVGCGCYRPLAEATWIEINRMFVLPDWRGQGVATLVLRELEAWAEAEGYSEAVLETGTGQPEAIALYGRCGYQRIPCFGPYAGMAESVCFSRRLGGAR